MKTLIITIAYLFSCFYLSGQIKGTSWGMSLEEVSRIQEVPVDEETTDYFEEGVSYGYMTYLPGPTINDKLTQVNFSINKIYGLHHCSYIFWSLSSEEIDYFKNVLIEKYGNYDNLFFGDPKFKKIYVNEAELSLNELFEKGFSVLISFEKPKDTIVEFTLIKTLGENSKIWGYIDYYEKEAYLKKNIPEREKAIKATLEDF
ncbi:MAG: hypothetical protein ACNS60_17390 [Candidatus Cyclobacteriaceae bacterium M2_1C_046]